MQITFFLVISHQSSLVEESQESTQGQITAMLFD